MLHDFYSNDCQNRDVKTDKVIGTATRNSSNVYILYDKRIDVILAMRMKAGCGIRD